MRLLDTIEAAEKERLAEWMTGLWVGARVAYHALTADGEMPQTRAEQKKPISNGRISRAKRMREGHDRQWLDALRSPTHFGAFIGMPTILGEPPAGEAPRERDAAFYERIDREAKSNVIDLLSHFENRDESEPRPAGGASY